MRRRGGEGGRFSQSGRGNGFLRCARTAAACVGGGVLHRASRGGSWRNRAPVRQGGGSGSIGVTRRHQRRCAIEQCGEKDAIPRIARPAAVDHARAPHGRHHAMQAIEQQLAAGRAALERHLRTQFAKAADHGARAGNGLPCSVLHRQRRQQFRIGRIAGQQQIHVRQHFTPGRACRIEAAARRPQTGTVIRVKHHLHACRARHARRRQGGLLRLRRQRLRNPGQQQTARLRDVGGIRARFRQLRSGRAAAPVREFTLALRIDGDEIHAVFTRDQRRAGGVHTLGAPGIEQRRAKRIITHPRDKGGTRTGAAGRDQRIEHNALPQARPYQFPAAAFLRPLPAGAATGLGAGQHESRIINSLGKSMRERCSDDAAMRRNNSCTAISLICWSGWRIVVSDGCTWLAAGISSKPTIEISWGIRLPFARAASITPNAISSLAAKMAVGGSGKLNNFWPASNPDNWPKSPSTINWPSPGKPASTSASR